MRSKSLRLFGTALSLSALTLLPACDRSDDDHGDDMQMLEVIDRGQTAQPVVATWTLSGGWEGSLPNVSLSSTNQRISLGFRAYAADGDQITLSSSGENSIRYALASGAAQGIIQVNREDIFHGDHVHIYASAVGITQIQFLHWHDDHADRATTGITLTVIP